jgi:hypothetical protein
MHFMVKMKIFLMFKLVVDTAIHSEISRIVKVSVFRGTTELLDIYPNLRFQNLLIF